MNLLLKKAAAILTAGIMTAASLGAECFAESRTIGETVISISKDAAVSKPTYQVKGTPGVRKIALSTTTVGATIYYTTNGSVPTTKSKVYSKLLKITKDVKIRAIAVKGGISSAVMTKTFKVKTLLGDVTGDGNINQNDYIKLRNYIDKKTTYICKDNADCNGSGGLSTKDLTVLKQYLDGKISKLPSNPVTTVAKPTGTITPVFGGKQIALSCSTSGSSIYYTTNGTTPTPTNGIKYSTAFTLDSSCTVKAIGYKNGDTSALKSFSVTVDKLGEVKADKAVNTTYNSPISVALSCSNSSRFIYTIDGTDPRTSMTASTYYSPIQISKDTTIKAYAQARGYANSEVYSFSYKVNGGFSISGTVWDDTPLNTTIANGIKDSGEPGIAGIKVYLINSTTNTAVKTTTTSSNGTYTFSDIESGYNYKIGFEYNGQLYKAYSSTVSGGNQAIEYGTKAITIKNGGAYDNNGTLFTAINSYASAKTSTVFPSQAVTSNTYSAQTTNADLALVSKNYGILDLSVTVTGQTSTTSTATVSPGTKLTYTITLTNNSPVTAPAASSAILNDAEITFYVTDAFSSYGTVKKTNNLNTKEVTPNNGYRKIIWSNFVDNGGLAPGKSLSIVMEGVVSSSAADNTQIKSFAEISSYRFSTNCYDYYSVPGNLSPTMTRTLEHDESTGTVITVYNSGNNSGSNTSNKSLATVISSTTATVGNKGADRLQIVAKNCKNQSDVIIAAETVQGIITYVPSYSIVGDDLYIFLEVTGVKAGSTSIPIMLASDTTKKVTVSVTVTAPASV